MHNWDKREGVLVFLQLNLNQSYDKGRRLKCAEISGRINEAVCRLSTKITVELHWRVTLDYDWIYHLVKARQVTFDHYLLNHTIGRHLWKWLDVGMAWVGCSQFIFQIEAEILSKTRKNYKKSLKPLKVRSSVLKMKLVAMGVFS